MPRKGKQCDEQASIISIYHQAVKNRIDKRNSSSEEGELINTSDEIEHMEVEPRTMFNTDKFISAMRHEYEEKSTAQIGETSGQQGCGNNYPEPMELEVPPGGFAAQQKQMPEDKAEQMIREAEENRMKIYGTPGNLKANFHLTQQNNYMHSVLVDEAFMIVASHLDEPTINKIKQG